MLVTITNTDPVVALISTLQRFAARHSMMLSVCKVSDAEETTLCARKRYMVRGGAGSIGLGRFRG